MKKFKEIDIAINIVLFVATLFMLVFGNEMWAFYLGYFGIGGLHIISMLVHTFGGNGLHLSNKRTFYHIVVLGVAILATAGIFIEPLIWILAFVMLFAGPVMAIIYFRMCYKETYYYNVRPLAVIK